MAVKDSLGDRMKEYYEDRAKTYLTRRTPVIIRLDGKAFHSFTKHLVKPYDAILHNTMNSTMKYLCENIQGCKFGYTQSDEITLVLVDYDKLETDAWFDYAVQKVCSISASMATMAFNKYFRFYRDEFVDSVAALQDYDTESKYLDTLCKCVEKGAMFDSRCFNIPLEEVVNCLIWRQQDATRNAIQMLGQCNFSYKELQGKSCNDIQDMLFIQKKINFNDMPTDYKRGTCCYRKKVPCPDRLVGYKSEWVIDKEPPIFTQDRMYVEKWVYMKEA